MRKLQLLGTILLLFFAVHLSYSEGRKQSTSEERSNVVETARLLETSPLSKDANSARKWLEQWINNSSDISVPQCQSLFKKDESRSKHNKELSFQIRASMAAFMIEHSDQANDPEARMMAAIEGVSKAYESILQKNPQDRSGFLDVLPREIAKQRQQTIREVMARCSTEPLSDRNPRSYSTGDTVYAWIEVGRPPDILTKQEPQYAEQARANRTRGIVVLQVVFSSSGAIADIEVIKGLADGLTQSSIAAAKTIRFKPAIKDNHPVSTLAKIEYEFHLF